MSSHSVPITLKKGGANQTIASNAMDSPHSVFVFVRNVGEGSAEVKLVGVTLADQIMEPHTARLIVLAKGEAITAKCTTADAYTVLLVDIQAATQISEVC